MGMAFSMRAYRIGGMGREMVEGMRPYSFPKTLTWRRGELGAPDGKIHNFGEIGQELTDQRITTRSRGADRAAGSWRTRAIGRSTFRRD
jgi:hypothetical protein